ncbi:hypothetical protein [Streptomyces sp. SID11385]|uniref:hypothetical protein n=1 Tax=Streptomyces sp. SID11385 TaxID=2706031 RepID=UPI0013C6B642|nr:hypothetical protein [Streptomyces sp. SID11385]NEA41447.1 hypothetical protein [Streptomyces sp. SID11385]
MANPAIPVTAPPTPGSGRRTIAYGQILRTTHGRAVTVLVTETGATGRVAPATPKGARR